MARYINTTNSKSRKFSENSRAEEELNKIGFVHNY